MLEEPAWEGLLFGDVSAMLQHNRVGALARLLEHDPSIHARLVNGSDYPLPALNLTIWMSELVDENLVSDEEADALGEIDDDNPLLFDYVAKRTMRGPKTRRALPAALFQRHADLPEHGDPAPSPSKASSRCGRAGDRGRAGASGRATSAWPSSPRSPASRACRPRWKGRRTSPG